MVLPWRISCDAGRVETLDVGTIVDISVGGALGAAFVVLDSAVFVPFK
jgi:hypothetical protein